MIKNYRRPRQCLASGLILVLLVSGNLRAALVEDWPRFLGPHANGTSRETNLIDKWAAGGPEKIWSAAVGTGYSDPSIMGSDLILHHRIGDQEIVECFDAATGKSKWRYPYPSQFVDPYGYNNGPRCTPLLTSNRCYTFGAEGKLLCLDRNGKLVWQRDTSAEWNIPPAFFGVGSTPILEGNLLIVMVGGQPNSGVVALNPESGKTIWESVGQTNWQGVPVTALPGQPRIQWQLREKQASYSTPTVAIIHGERHLLCLMRQGLVSLNPTNGQVNFSFGFRSRVNDSVNAMTPVVIDDLILISAAYYHVGSILLRVKSDGRSVEDVWRSAVLETHWNTPISDHGYLYAFSGRNEPDAHFRCVEFKTGKLMWDRDESWPPHSTPQPKVYGRGSAIMADGKLIVLGEGGLLGLFKPNAKEPQEVCRWQVPELHYSCWASPVLSHRKLYLRSEDRLVCLDFGK